MAQPLLKDLDDLIAQNIISADTAKQIKLYYAQKNERSSSRLPLVMGIIAALLVSSGIILLIAHNWDMLSRTVRSIIAFLPMLTGQVLCGYALLKKKDNRGWLEIASIILFFGVATCIALIAQIYQVNGSLEDFLLTWIITTIALVYIMPSSIVSLLIIILATWHATLTGYSVKGTPYQYVIIMLLLVPHYYRYLKHNASSNFFIFHNWFAVISFPIVLGAFIWNGYNYFEWVFIGYMALASIFYLLGNLAVMKNRRLLANPFLLAGTPAIIGFLLTWTFGDVWDELKYSSGRLFHYPFTYIAIGLLIVCAILLFFQFKRSGQDKFDIMAFSPFIFTACVLLLRNHVVAGLLMFNLWLIVIGIFYIRKGTAQDHLGVLNFGLIVIALLALFRFFDSDIPFVLRGLIFIAAGAGFFISNSLILKKRKSQAKNIVP